MAPTRQSARGKRVSTPPLDTAQQDPKTPRSAKRNSAIDSGGDTIMTSESVLVPPSPGLFSAMPSINKTPSTDGPGLPVRRSTRFRSNFHSVSRGITGAGIKKAQPKSKTVTQKLVDAAASAAKATGDKVQKSFRFLDLPGEIRNLVYLCTYEKPRQALLVHRPRVASLRSRTRLDRQRTLASDIKDKEIGDELATSRRRQKGDGGENLARESNRPFYGLTHVCRQVRQEFRPIYLQKQEIGMDLTDIVQYLQTFYFDAAPKLDKLFDENGVRGKDLPFTGNLTIAVGEKVTDLEKKKDGIEIIPLLDLWANSFKIEAGFGRYLKVGYHPQSDGEAKDLYHLFGRRVLKNRSCSSMNTNWRTILRNRCLASVTLHRKPKPTTVHLDRLLPAAARFVPHPAISAMLHHRAMLPVETKPFIHMLFRAECKETWMTKEVSDIPATWLADRGFGNMEHFTIKVGVVSEDTDRRV